MKRPLLIEVDKAQAEWVIVAHLADDPQMLRVVREGLDAHAMTGHLISKVPVDVIKEEAKLLGHLTDPDLLKHGREKMDFPDLFGAALSNGGFIPESMTIRQMGKKSNHALDYDMTAQRFALENGVPLSESKIIVDAYHIGYPGIRQRFHGDIQKQLEKDRTLYNCFGRKRRFLAQWSKDLLKEAYAHIPQSTVADIINKAYVQIYKYETPKGTFLPITQVHDSILLEAYYNSSEELWKGLGRVEKYMDPILYYNNHDFNIDTDFTAGYSWGEENMFILPLDDGYDEFKEALERVEATA